MSLLTILCPTTEKDYQAIYNTHLHAIQYACICSYGETIMHVQESLFDINSYLETISDKNKALWTAEYEGLIQGFFQVGLKGARPDALYVHPLPHNLGSDTALLSCVEEMARNTDLSFLKLYASLNSVSSYRFNRHESLDAAVLQLNKIVCVECELMRRYL